MTSRLKLARRAGDRRTEGLLLAEHAVELAVHGHHERARRGVSLATAVLREADDLQALAVALCRETRIELLAGRSVEAGEALEEAEAIVETRSSPGDPSLIQLIHELRRAVEEVTG